MHSFRTKEKKKTLGRVKIHLVPCLSVKFFPVWGRGEKNFYFAAGRKLVCIHPSLSPILSSN
jgi:hypothetical protein